VTDAAAAVSGGAISGGALLVNFARTFGAPLGGAVSADQYGFDCAALGSIWPLNGCRGEGKYLPSMVVAPGEPGVPVVCWAPAGTQAKAVKMAANINVLVLLSMAFSTAYRSRPVWAEGRVQGSSKMCRKSPVPAMGKSGPVSVRPHYRPSSGREAVSDGLTSIQV